MARRVAVVVGLTGLAQLSAAGLYMRYSVPIAAALLVPIVAFFAPILTRRAVTVGWLGVTLVLAASHARRLFPSETSLFTETARTIAGLEDRVDFLRHQLPLFRLYERVNRDSPANAKIMLSGYCGSFYIDRDTYCGEMVQSALRFSSWEDFTSDLRRLGITHVIAPSVLATDEPTPFPPISSVSAITRKEQYRMVRKLLGAYARPLETASDQGLYEISPSLLERKALTQAAPAD
jgi:hypothetical protein